MYSYAHYRCGRNATEAWKGEILLRTWDEDGNSIVKRFPHKSTVYYENGQGEFTGVYGNSLSKMEFENIFTKKRWKEDYGIRRTYGEFAPDMEFLQDTFFGFNRNPEFFNTKLRVAVVDIETAIDEDAGVEAFDSERCEYPINLISHYDSQDDETHVFMYLNSHWYDKPENERPWKNTRKIKYHVYTHYHEMLNSYLIYWKNHCPDVVTGWNLKLFDMPYIINECYNVLSDPDDMERGIDIVANHLSPMQELIKREERTGYDGSHSSYYQIVGVNILDYKDLYKDAYGKSSLSNFKLETVCQEELGVGKLENPETTFYKFYTKHWEKFVEYNIIDVDRVWELEQKLKFIELAKTVAYTSLIPIEKVFVTTPVVMGALNQEVKLNERVMITSTGIEDVAQEYEGAFVKDPLRGIYSEGVFSIDLNSLYPNIMITLNLSNETYVGKIVEEDTNGVVINMNGKLRKMNWVQFNQKLKPRVNRAANNALFLKHTEKEGVIPKFLSKTYNNRRDTKDEMLLCYRKIDALKEALKTCEDKEKRKQIKRGIEVLDSQAKQLNANQTAFKLLMNSLYGLFANPYSAIFNTVLAEAITISGQEIIKLSGDYIDEYAKENLGVDYPVTIYSDTDSAYVNAEPFLKAQFGENIKWTRAAVQEYCDYLDAEIVPLINKNCERIVKDEFWSDKSTIEFKRETMCSHGAFVAKKRYCLLVRNDEGTPVKKWKYTGLDVKKNEYTKETKQSLSDTIETMILENWDNPQFSDHIYKLWEEFRTRTPEQVGVIKGYNTYKKYYGGFRSEPGTLAHVRALHYHNDIIHSKNLGLQDLRFREKMQFVFVKPNENEFHIDVMAFDFEWPKAFDDMFEVDYRELFNRTIIKPLKSFIELKHYVVPNVEQKEVFDINEL
jgi:DNA polymerase elongation subunit (family B)